MPIETSVVGLTEVREMLEGMPEYLFDKAKKEFSKSVLEAQSSITLPMSIGRFGLQNRTGNLSRSIKTSVTGNTLSSLKASVFTKSPYALIHEKGGKIDAKNAYLGLAGGPYLNIPSSFNKTPKGIMRYSAQNIFAMGAYIVKISAPKAKYMVVLNGKPMFWLVKSVTLKARLHMVEFAEAEIPTLLSSLNNVLLEDIESS